MTKSYFALMNPEISVLMPARNADKYLEACLDSIIAQDFLSWELIVVNDHSTDDTEKILYKFASLDSRIRFYDNDGKGIIAALRMSFKKSRGNFITRMDADDLMTPDKLSSMFTLLNVEEKDALVIGKVKYFSEEPLGAGYLAYAEWLNGLSKNKELHKEVFKECVIPSPSWMCSKDFLMKCGAFEEDRYPEDYDLCFRFLSLNPKIFYTKVIVHYWRDYATRSSRTDPNYADNNFLDIKLFYFLRNYCDTQKHIILWGAGQASKKIAAKLMALGKEFYWVSNNPNKIGHNIYGVVLEHFHSIRTLEAGQIIIRIGNREELNEVKQWIAQELDDSKFEAFYFC